MLIDIFYKNVSEGISRTVYLGRLEVEKNILKNLNEKDKNDVIQGMILVSLSTNIEWTPVSENIEENIPNGYKLN